MVLKALGWCAVGAPAQQIDSNTPLNERHARPHLQHVHKGRVPVRAAHPVRQRRLQLLDELRLRLQVLGAVLIRRLRMRARAECDKCRLSAALGDASARSL